MIISIRRVRWLIGILVHLVSAGLPATAGTTEAGHWILVDTETATLSVMLERQPRLVFDDIAIGRFGTSADKRRGDGKTPTGTFRVRAIRHDSGFHRFIALDYPDAPRARRAWEQGVIDRPRLRAIVAAHERGRLPPQDTPLGGHIGIHGLGRADPELHRRLNWTRGCIALTDAQVDRLLPWVRLGMPVVIR